MPPEVVRAKYHAKVAIVNFQEWRAHLLARLRHQIDVTADPLLLELMSELRAYPVPGNTAPDRHRDRRSLRRFASGPA